MSSDFNDRLPKGDDDYIYICSTLCWAAYHTFEQPEVYEKRKLSFRKPSLLLSLNILQLPFSTGFYNTWFFTLGDLTGVPSKA